MRKVLNRIRFYVLIPRNICSKPILALAGLIVRTTHAKLLLHSRIFNLHTNMSAFKRREKKTYKCRNRILDKAACQRMRRRPWRVFINLWRYRKKRILSKYNKDSEDIAQQEMFSVKSASLG